MVKLNRLTLLFIVVTTTFVLANPTTHPRIMELENMMQNGIRLSAEESYELGQLTSSPSSPLVKRDSCANCAKDYQCLNLSCNDF
ncbi:hypothetical protein BGZ99_000601, partial [Dissophora globulifera]